MSDTNPRKVSRPVSGGVAVAVGGAFRAHHRGGGARAAAVGPAELRHAKIGKSGAGKGKVTRFKGTPHAQSRARQNVEHMARMRMRTLNRR